MKCAHTSCRGMAINVRCFAGAHEECTHMLMNVVYCTATDSTNLSISQRSKVINNKMFVLLWSFLMTFL